MNLDAIIAIMRKYWKFFAVAFVAVVAWGLISRYINTGIIHSNTVAIDSNKVKIEQLEGRIQQLLTEIDSLNTERERGTKVINYYTTKLESPKYKIETNPDSAYVFLQKFAKESAK